jgi:hypothetical protein
MPIDSTKPTTDGPEIVHTPHHVAPSRRSAMPRRAATVIAALALIGVGAAAGAGGFAMMRPAAQMAPATPIAINALPQWGLVTVKGKVAEIYGNKFIVADDTGRALIETGREGEGGRLVAKDDAVTVQGRAEGGFIHATFLVRADGTVEALGPGGPPPRGPRWMQRLVGEAPPP